MIVEWRAVSSNVQPTVSTNLLGLYNNIQVNSLNNQAGLLLSALKSYNNTQNNDIISYYIPNLIFSSCVFSTSCKMAIIATTITTLINNILANNKGQRLFGYRAAHYFSSQLSLTSEMAAAEFGKTETVIKDTLLLSVTKKDDRTVKGKQVAVVKPWCSLRGSFSKRQAIGALSFPEPHQV